MTSLVYGIEKRGKRNYGIKRKNIFIITREHLLFFVPLVLIAAALFFQLSVRARITETGYRINELSQREEALNRELEKLAVKQQALQSPERIDRIARGRLGMEPLRPDQILTPAVPYVPFDRSVVAMNRN